MTIIAHWTLLSLTLQLTVGKGMKGIASSQSQNQRKTLPTRDAASQRDDESGADAAYRRCRRPCRSAPRHVTCPAGSPPSCTALRAPLNDAGTCPSCRRRSSEIRSGRRWSRHTCFARSFAVHTPTSRSTSMATVSAGSQDTTEVRVLVFWELLIVYHTR